MDFDKNPYLTRLLRSLAMETNTELKGKTAELPDGQKVVVEEVKDGFATVRRVEGERDGSIAVCRVGKLSFGLQHEISVE